MVNCHLGHFKSNMCSVLENLLKFSMHCMLVEKNCMYVVCIKNETEYYKRLTINLRPICRFLTKVYIV